MTLIYNGFAIKKIAIFAIEIEWGTTHEKIDDGIISDVNANEPRCSCFAEEAIETTVEVSSEETKDTEASEEVEATAEVSKEEEKASEESEKTEAEAVTDAQEVTEESEEAVESEKVTETESVKEVSAGNKAKEATEVSAGTDRTAVAAEEEPLMLTAASSEPATTEEQTSSYNYFGKVIFYDEDNKYNSRTGGVVIVSVYPNAEYSNPMGPVSLETHEKFLKNFSNKTKMNVTEENGWTYSFTSLEFPSMDDSNSYYTIIPFIELPANPEDEKGYNKSRDNYSFFYAPYNVTPTSSESNFIMVRKQPYKFSVKNFADHLSQDEIIAKLREEY